MMTNLDRANDISPVMEAFTKDQGLDPSLDSDGPVTVATDMICNILHWVHSETGGMREDALDAAKLGIMHFVSEFYIDYDLPEKEIDEVGPDANVTIEVQCNNQYWRADTGTSSIITE